MKFTCSREAILAVISIAQEVISSRNTLSILSNVLIETHDNSLTVKATDLNVGFETQISIETASPGSTTVYCDKFLGILRSLPEGEVEFEQQDQRLDIRPLFKKIDFQLKTIAGDKYPALQDVEEKQYFEIGQKEFLEMIQQTIFAVSDDETRYFMNGVYMETVDGNIAMVATDGRRLSFIQKSLGAPVPEFQGVIIPPKVLTMIGKLASGEGNLSIAVTEKHIFFQIDSKRFSSNLIEGHFPDYNRVIPESQEFQFGVDKSELSAALSRVSLLVEKKSQRILLSVNDDTLLLHSEESEIGVAREELSCSYEGPETSIAINYRYLVEPMKVIDDETIVIKFTDSKKAISVLPNEEEEYVHIIAPMQLD